MERKWLHVNSTGIKKKKTFVIVKRIFNKTNCNSLFIHLFLSNSTYWDCGDRRSFTMARNISLGWRRYLTVEPVILLYTFGLMTSMPIWDQYVYSTLSKKRGFPYDELVVEKEGIGCNFTELNSTLKDLEQQVRWSVKWCAVHIRPFDLNCAVNLTKQICVP